ncbi:MAG: DUF2905 domain-containing protein [Gammaproteobacteria bacterium]
MAKVLILAGVVLLLIGLILQLAPGLLGWFGNLPGDIRIRGEKYSIFIPITSMIVLSVIGSILIQWFFRR